MTTDEILFELRTLPGAPDAVRERVRAMPEPAPRREWTLPRIEWRRVALVGAPAAVALAFGAAAIHGLVAPGRQSATQTAQREFAATTRASGGSAERSAKTPVFGAVTTTPTPPQALDSLATPALPPPSATRLNRYQAWLRVRVERDKLGNATTQAMRIARGYGGYVASVDLNTPASRGRAFLVLRVPVTKVQDAVLRLGRLGEVTAQRVRIQDLQRQFDAQQRELTKLRVHIAGLERALKNPALPAGQRLRLQLQLQEAKRSLSLKTRAHGRTAREGRLATISVGFSAPTAAAATPHHEGRLERSVRDAGGFLVAELSWILYALIVAAPIAVLVAVALFGARAVRRGSNRRLLEGA
jgi:Domain of unknown function (DUF4349)